MKAFAIIACLLASPALAHNVECSGRAVPDHIKDSCCGKADAHQVTAADIEETDTKYFIHSGKYVLPVDKKRAEPSDDGCYWIFYSEAYMSSETGSPLVFCFQMPFAL